MISAMGIILAISETRRASKAMRRQQELLAQRQAEAEAAAAAAEGGKSDGQPATNPSAPTSTQTEKKTPSASAQPSSTPTPPATNTATLPPKASKMQPSSTDRGNSANTPRKVKGKGKASTHTSVPTGSTPESSTGVPSPNSRPTASTTTASPLRSESTATNSQTAGNSQRKAKGKGKVGSHTVPSQSNPRTTGNSTPRANARSSASDMKDSSTAAAPTTTRSARPSNRSNNPQSKQALTTIPTPQPNTISGSQTTTETLSQPTSAQLINDTPETKGKRKSKKSKAAKADAQNAHYALVLSAAETVVSTLKQHNIQSAVFGSLACKLYGCSRNPKDVDLLVLERPPSPSDSDAQPQPLHTAIDLKNLILSTNSRNFYLKMPRDPTATYRILWYRSDYLGPECKVDILTPGTMYLPNLPPAKVVFNCTTLEKSYTGNQQSSQPGAYASNSGSKTKLYEIPCVPFPLLLTHKLQGWDDHRTAEEAHKRKKQQQDAGDLKRMMALSKEIDLLEQANDGHHGSILDDLDLFSEEFAELTRIRVRAYSTRFPERADGWKKLGFDTTPLENMDKEHDNLEGTNKQERNEQEEGTEDEADGIEEVDDGEDEAVKDE